ncbi:UDP-glucose/GDP-mannose dehydrogenase family protein [Aurantimonas sp. A2-1-M11]|uniref:UDP-glucose dehydrogenase family protein n=1 Tax=Aurantimonas sp. A2-1-M11 TaxID=3113712 RepID=UPI002F91EDD5
MKIVMVGAGYVGLVSGACFADFGHSVVCVDKDPERLEQLRNGRIPIYEPGLEDLVKTGVQRDRLRFDDDLGAAVATADVVFLAVGTPSRRGDGHADLSYVHAAAAEIARAIHRYTVIVTKSTVPVGTGDEIERIVREINPAAEFAIVSNPEFLREGSAIEDFRHPDRVVIGTDDERAKKVMDEVYRPLSLNRAPIFYTGRRSAELIKYAANAFLAMKITFINEMADLCEALDADVQDVARGIGMDGRIGPKFLNAGPGYGGSCFPKDTLALVKTGQDAGVPVRLVETTVAINDQRKRAMGRKIVQACDGSVRGKTIALLGLTFKPNTDDMRDAPSLSIIQALKDGGATIRAFDPVGMEQARKIRDDIEFCDDAYAAANGAHALVIVTEWNEFRSLDLPRLRTAMCVPVLVDLKNIYEGPELATSGFRHVRVGRAETGELRGSSELRRAG